MLRILLAASLLLGVIPQARATTPFCPALSDPQTYKIEGNEDFAMMAVGKDGWLFRSRLDLKFRFRITEKTKESFARLDRAFAAQGTDMVIAMLPTRGIMHHDMLAAPYDQSYDYRAAQRNYLTMLDELRAAGLDVADMKPILDTEGFYRRDDNHWTDKGARATAQAVADMIKGLAAYKDIEKKSFKTVAEQIDEKSSGRYIEFINRVCGTATPREKMESTFATVEASGGKVTEDALFADAAAPDIALIGTSNSESPAPSFANFEGFLKEYLRADILNEAVSGGSLQGSIGNYLLNGVYARTKPKIIIWEMSAYYGFNQQSFLREMIPAVYGVCAKPVAQAAGNVNGAEKTTVLFSGMGAKGLSSHKYYLSLKLSDKAQRMAKIKFTHADGRIR